MEKIKNNLKKIGWFLQLIYQLKPSLFVIIVIGNIVKSIIPFVNLFFSMIIINELAGDCDKKTLFQYALAAVTVNGVLLLISSIAMYFEKIKTENLKLAFDKKIVEHQMNLPYVDIESNKVQEMKRVLDQANMVNGGLYNIVQISSTLILDFMSMIIASISFVQIFQNTSKNESSNFWSSPVPVIMLLSISVLLIVISFFMKMKQNEKVVQLNLEFNRGNGGAFGFMQIVSDYNFGKDARVYRMHTFLGKYFEKLWSSSIGYKVLFKLGKEKAKLPCITAAVDAVIEFLIYVIASRKAFSGEIDVGSVVLYVGSIHLFIQSVSNFVYAIGDLSERIEIMSPYKELFEMSEEERKGLSCEKNERFVIHFEHVSFHYPGIEEYALKDIDLTIQSGEKIAIVGQNGSGKTTLIKLLCRLYDPTEGRITLDGVDIREYDIISYRKRLGVVFQDFYLFSFSIAQTVATDRTYSDEIMEKVLEQTGIDAWVSSLPNQVNTYIHHDYEEHGVEPSGGEAQKLAISRALYQNPDCVILDEPTAALDPRSEAEIYELIHQKIQDKTIIYISHRLSSCSFSKRILVLDTGTLIQDGTHQQLLEQKGKYQELWNAQAEMYRS